jgi:hypothetical protein
MSKVSRTVIFVAITLGSGVLGYWLRGHQLSSVSEEWFEDTVPRRGNDSGVAYTTDALFNSDIPFPDITGVKAKTKFIRAAGGGRNVTVGYLAQVDVAKLDPSKIPNKYKTKKAETSKSGEWTTEPLKEVVYSAHFSFSLLDKDGFALAQVEGATHDLLSGRSNTLQEIVKQPIALDIAQRAVKIVPKLSIDKCISCG